MCRKFLLYSALLAFIGIFFGVSYAENKTSNIVLITIDTARADHFGFAGYKDSKTPNIDKLAAESINFVNTYSAVPLTLPSHVSILTGLYPQTHGVHDNDLFQLRKSVETLAEFLKTKNYHNAAFVSSIILGHHYGLDQGFDYYNDLGQYATIKNRIVERTANTTTDAVCKYTSKLQAPFFLWVHYFDPHFPYQPPEPFAKEYEKHPYDGEISYVDSSIGLLLDCIEKIFNKKDTLVIVTSDHGEGLGQHDEDRHGVLLYNSTIKVPLLIKVPDRKPVRITDNTSLVDIVPTILDYVQIPVPKYLEGKSLVPYFANQKNEPINKDRILFLETFMPYFTYRWAPLFGTVMGEHKFIKAALPELYSMKKDPDETINLFLNNKNLGFTYSSAMYSFFKQGLIYPWDIKQFFNSAASDADIKEKLKSLGYVSSPPAPIKQPAKLPDPKSKIYIIKKLDYAQELLYKGIYNEAFAILEEVLKNDKENGPALTLAADCLMSMKMYAEAKPFLKKAEELYPQNDSILVSLAVINKNTGKPSESEQLLFDALQMNPMNPSAHANLILLYLSINELAKAEKALKDAKDKQINHPDIYFAEGSYYIRRQQFEEAKKALEKGLEQSPDNISAIANLAKIYYLQGNSAKTIELYEKFLSINPNDAQINAFLGALYLNNMKNKNKALQYLNKALQLDPNNEEADKWRLIISEIQNQ